jgi:hypothetical protein
MRVALRPYLVLLALWALYFHPLVLRPTHTLFAPYSDMLTEHLPARMFQIREWRAAGELPLWKPYHFCGTPAVHDIQVGAFYPPYAVTLLFPEAAAGAVMSWVVALHVLAAGGFTLAYARHQGLGEAGSLVAAVGWMFAGKWMTHLLLAGQTITVGLAWLPLVLLGLERGTRAGGVGPVLVAGAALALMILGTHPQWTFYAGVFALCWTLPTGQTRAHVRRWLLTGVGAVAVALGLAAVQLLPTVEAAGQSSRAGGVAATGSLALALPTLLGAVVPAPDPTEPIAWEGYAAMGPVWVAAALAAPARGRRLVLLGLVFFSAGGAVLVEWLPGFNLFRIPGRMLLVAGFPLAVLAGTTTDALVRTGWGDPCRRAARRWLVPLALVLIPCGVYSWYALAFTRDGGRAWASSFWLAGPVGWAAFAVSLPAALYVLRPAAGRPDVRLAGWLVVLLLDRVAPTVLFPVVLPQSQIQQDQLAVRFLADHLPPGTGRVLDVPGGPDADSLLGVGAPRSLVHGIDTVRGYNSIDVKHYREFLAFAAGADEPLQANGPFTQPAVPIVQYPHQSLLDMVGLRYVASPTDGGGIPVGRPWRHDPFQPHAPPGWRPVVYDPNPVTVPPFPARALLGEGGLPRQTVYENAQAYPRTWVVPEARPMPAGGEYAALTSLDFRRTVLLTTARPLPPPAAAVPAARVAEYRPNRVRIELTGDGGGWLILTDVWYPGWVCRVDGVEVPVERANHAFRAVELPPGAKEAVFAFEPRSYRVGWWVSAASLAGLAVVGGGLLLRRAVAARAAGAYPIPTPSPAGLP